MNWASHLYSFYKNLQPPPKLPNGVEWLYPQKDPVVMEMVEQFLQRYYADTKPRKIFLGINPGRFGAGVTGVNFTSPRQLKEVCGINHPYKDQTELSAEFIYEMIAAYGGPEKFYGEFFIGSVCPLGFVKEGRNINYYDDRGLAATVAPFIIESTNQLLSYHADTSTCFCIGGEKNFKYLSALNDKHQWFGKIEPLPHPRFIMQYRRKQKEQFIQQYLQLMTQ
ncbi:MAG: uracil-DNA glycosylase family protein [Flavisolibacter sp.]